LERGDRAGVRRLVVDDLQVEGPPVNPAVRVDLADGKLGAAPTPVCATISPILMGEPAAGGAGRLWALAEEKRVVAARLAASVTAPIRRCTLMDAPLIP